MSEEILRIKVFDDGSKLIGALTWFGINWLVSKEEMLKSMGYNRFWRMRDGTPFMAKKEVIQQGGSK